MSGVLRKMKVRRKLGLLVFIFVAGFLIFGTFSYTGFSMVKVNGPIYNDIVQGKDLIADVLPPPEYIIESYLIVLQMTGETDKARIDDYIQRGIKLKDEYDIRHEFWIKDLPAGVMKTVMVEKAYEPAIEFFKIRDEEFIPAVLKGDRTKAETLAYGVLKQKYEAHRAQIDEVVRMATARNQEDEKKAQRTVFLITAVLIAVGMTLILCTLFFWYFIGRSFKPVEQVRDMLRDISAGEGDLTKRITVNADDEIGEMAKYFNRFIETVQGIVRSIYETTLTLGKASTDLIQVSNDIALISEQANDKANTVSSTTEEITGSIEEVASSIGNASDNINVIASTVEEMSVTIRNIATASGQTSTNVAQASDRAENISKSIRSVSDFSKDVSSSVSSMAIAIEEINLSLNEINRNCVRSTQITADASDKANDTSTIISKLSASSKQIEKIINMINDIADQTNMLALNAAIEAAGAGEAGKGFAVVASEVKELAKQTAEATDEISQQIETMQSNMADAVNSVGTITGVVKEITLITNTIAAAVTEQSATTGEISKSVAKASGKVTRITDEIGEIALNSQDVAANISEASKGVKEIARSTTELAVASNDVAKSIDMISSMVNEVVVTSEEVSSGSQEIAQNIYEISDASASTAQGAQKTSHSAKALSEITQKLAVYVKQFRI